MYLYIKNVYKKHGGHPNRLADYSDLETRHVHCKIAEGSIRSDTGYPISFLKIHIYRDIQYLRVPDI